MPRFNEYHLTMSIKDFRYNIVRQGFMFVSKTRWTISFAKFYHRDDTLISFLHLDLVQGEISVYDHNHGIIYTDRADEFNNIDVFLGRLYKSVMVNHPKHNP